MPAVECGVAQFVLAGQGESGDQHLVCRSPSGILIATVDGIGHGEEAASAAKTATSILRAEMHEPVISLVERCHEQLRLTRGVVMSLAFVDVPHGMMTWLGVGNVQGVLLRAGGAGREMLLLRGGVVGAQLPALQAAVLPIRQGDNLVFATDGVREEFIESLSPLEGPQHAAERILARYGNGNDDALVLVARFNEARP